jgi:hypothetical protein
MPDPLRMFAALLLVSFIVEKRYSFFFVAGFLAVCARVFSRFLVPVMVLLDFTVAAMVLALERDFFLGEALVVLFTIIIITGNLILGKEGFTIHPILSCLEPISKSISQMSTDARDSLNVQKCVLVRLLQDSIYLTAL